MSGGANSDAQSQREMHPSLRIPEIVRMICTLLTAPAELAAMARTCNLFSDAALDVLWRRQDSILNLIRCMPPDLWETGYRPGLTASTLVRHNLPVLFS